MDAEEKLQHACDRADKYFGDVNVYFTYDMEVSAGIACDDGEFSFDGSIDDAESELERIVEFASNLRKAISYARRKEEALENKRMELDV